MVQLPHGADIMVELGWGVWKAGMLDVCVGWGEGYAVIGCVGGVRELGASAKVARNDEPRRLTVKIH